MFILLILGVGCDSFTTAQTEIWFFNPAQSTLHVYVADTPTEHTQGLGAVESLAADEGMLFIFPTPTTPHFWMKDMEYPLDMIWIRDEVVVGVTEQVPVEAPGTRLANYVRYAAPEPVDMVVEVPAGVIAAQAIAVGQRLDYPD